MGAALGICIVAIVLLAIWLFWLDRMVVAIARATSKLIDIFEDNNEEYEKEVEKLTQKADKIIEKGMSPEKTEKALDKLMKESELKGTIKVVKMKGKK